MGHKKSSLFLLVMVLFLFGCAQKKPVNEIVIWHNMRPEEKTVLQRQLNEFMKLHPDIKVSELYRETETMRSGYIIAAIGGQGPDLVY